MYVKLTTDKTIFRKGLDSHLPNSLNYEKEEAQCNLTFRILLATLNKHGFSLPMELIA